MGGAEFAGGMARAGPPRAATPVGGSKGRPSARPTDVARGRPAIGGPAGAPQPCPSSPPRRALGAPWPATLYRSTGGIGRPTSARGVRAGVEGPALAGGGRIATAEGAAPAAFLPLISITPASRASSTSDGITAVVLRRINDAAPPGSTGDGRRPASLRTTSGSSDARRAAVAGVECAGGVTGAGPRGPATPAEAPEGSAPARPIGVARGSPATRGPGSTAQPWLSSAPRPPEVPPGRSGRPWPARLCRSNGGAGVPAGDGGGLAPLAGGARCGASFALTSITPDSTASWSQEGTLGFVAAVGASLLGSTGDGQRRGNRRTTPGSRPAARAPAAGPAPPAEGPDERTSAGPDGVDGGGHSLSGPGAASGRRFSGEPEYPCPNPRRW